MHGFPDTAGPACISPNRCLRCCLRPIRKPRHPEPSSFRCSIAPSIRTATDASPAPSREPAHGSRRNVVWLLLRSGGLSPPTFCQFAWRTGSGRAHIRASGSSHGSFAIPDRLSGFVAVTRVRSSVSSRVSLSRLCPCDASLSSSGSRRPRFPTFTGTIKALRLPIPHPLGLLFRRPVPCEPAGVRSSGRTLARAP